VITIGIVATMIVSGSYFDTTALAFSQKQKATRRPPFELS
jgi:hypothetical protein